MLNFFRFHFAILSILVAHFSFAQEAENFSKYVDPWIGSHGAGNVYVGPSMPFGMVKPCADCGDNGSNSGWKPSGNINGFSQTHVSGTGGGAKYGNILVMPTCGDVDFADISSPRKNEEVSCGYYGVELERYGIKAEITTTERVAFYKFSYPKSKNQKIVFDTGHFLYNNIAGEGQILTDCAVEILSAKEVAGHTSLKGGWNKQSEPFTVYFYASLDTKSSSFGVVNDGNVLKNQKKAESKDGKKSSAWFEFAGDSEKVVNLKVGISFVSVEQAKKNVNQVRKLDFNSALKRVISAWDKALSPIKVEGADENKKKIFYTSVYHAMLMPVDRTGENPLWKSKEPYYDDFYAIWDTFRTSGPLLNLIAPKRQSEIVRSLIDMYRHEGFLPDGRSGNFNGRTQGGSDADIYIADAFVKGIKGVNWQDAYEALKTDAEVEPKDHFKEGRGGVEDWKKLGYVSKESVDRSACKHVEYAYNDFCVAQLALGLGKQDEAQTYLKRSKQWVNLWDSELEHDGFKGFIRTRYRNGKWLENFTPLDGCSWHGDTFYEGNSWTYSFFVPQEMYALIEKCGGRETFVKRLDEFFKNKCDMGNEPAFLTPYLYIFAGSYEKSAKEVKRCMGRYSSEKHGIPGNDDSGALGCWYALSSISLFPVAGQDYYLLASPDFEKATLNLANGKTFEISAQNLSNENIYIESATLNGKPFNQAWITHSQIMQGGELVLKMSSTPSEWGTSNLPESPKLFGADAK